MAGVMFDIGGDTVPEGALLCDGQQLEQSAYPDLYAAIGTLWGAAGPGQFTLPPRLVGGWGAFICGTGEYVVGTQLSSQVSQHNHAATCTTDGNHRHYFSFNMRNDISAANHSYATSNGTNISAGTSWKANHTHSLTVNSTGAGESYPVYSNIQRCIWT